MMHPELFLKHVGNRITTCLDLPGDHLAFVRPLMTQLPFTAWLQLYSGTKNPSPGHLYVWSSPLPSQIF